MGKKFISILALVVLAICLISGGCTSLEKYELKSWKDLLENNPIAETPDLDKIIKNIDDADQGKTEVSDLNEQELITVDLYFIGSDGSKLVKETRSITKEEGLARSTIGELIKGPATEGNLSVFPDDTSLLDINIKPEGNCIVDFSGQLAMINDKHQGELVVFAIVNTLAQFDSVKDVQILVNGNRIDTLGGYKEIFAPLEPDYTL